MMSKKRTHPGKLATHHVSELLRSGIKFQAARAADIYSESKPDKLTVLLGREPGFHGNAIVFRYRDSGGSLNGYCRIKPDNPRKDDRDRAVKYEAPSGEPPRVYFPPGTIAALPDLRKPLFLTEGEKKSLAADVRGIPCIGLSGAWSWGKDGTLLPDLEAIEWRGRNVYIVFDSDVVGRFDLETAEFKLAEALAEVGAKVKIVRLPPGPDGQKVGLDDYLVQNSVADFRKLVDNATDPADPHKNCITNFRLRTPLSLRQISDRLLDRTGGFPKQLDGRLFVVDETRAVLWLENSSGLFAWMGSVARVVWKRTGPNKAEFYEHLRQTAPRVEAIERLPHHPPLANTLYAVQGQPKGDRGRYVKGLLDKFCPATPVDGQLLKAFFLSLFWGGPAGSRPGFLITAKDNDPEGGRGVGKSSVAPRGATLAGGSIEASARDDIGEIKTRLLSPTAMGLRLAILDNIKTHRFSWDELEAIITCRVVSGRRLYVGEGCIRNLLTWVLTLNGASLSKDLAQRCVIIKLRRPTFSAEWKPGIDRYVEQNRWGIIGDILAVLRGEGKKLASYTRWADWESAVLSRVRNPEKCQQVILERQNEVDDDQGQADQIRAEFRKSLKERKIDPDKERKIDPDTSVVFIPASTAATWFNVAMQDNHPANRVSAILSTLPIPELRKTVRRGVHGWRWQGTGAKAGTKMTVLKNQKWTKKSV